MTILEICVDDVAGVQMAARAGADRVEICRDLSNGGLTPSAEDIAAASRINLPLGIQVLIRPQDVSFVLTSAEIERMCQTMVDVDASVRADHASASAVGFVVGAVTEDGSIDLDAARRFRQSVPSSFLTFHRAFDTTNDQVRSLAQLIDLGYDAVLTTGGDSILADTTALRALVEQAGDEIQIIGSGGIRSHNVRQVVDEASLPAVHMRAPGPGGVSTSESEVERIVSALGRR